MKKILSTKKYYIIILVIFLTFIYLVYQNTNIKITNITYVNEKIPDSFNDFVLCHITDLHDANFGDKQADLMKIIKDGNPDIIVFTGDFIDASRYDLDNSMNLIRGIIDIAPIYYVSGNHEVSTNEYVNIIQSLDEAGVIIMENQFEFIYKNEEVIKLIGIADYDTFVFDRLYDVANTLFDSELKRISDGDEFKILLSHRPELFDTYVNNNIDLIFTGHAHGGQFRLPIIGGIIAPNQGVFPEYTSGFYYKNSTSMYVNRGLGNSVIPLRVFNNPEVLFLTLKSR